MNWEVGKATTKILEELVKDYIGSYTVHGKYVGKVQYLERYRSLLEYNSKK